MPEMPAEPTATPSETPAAPERGKAWYVKVIDVLGEFLHVIVISLAIIVPIRYFLIQPFYVKGASMEPNFYDHEYLIIDELSYRLNPPQRGDVVVFRYPNDPRQFYIKRVIGLPGERVRVTGGHVFIHDAAHPDGFRLDETPYLGDLLTSGERDVAIPEDQYYLLGDNRGASLDSRIFGPVSDNLVVGRVWLRGWPPERMSVFGSPPTAAPAAP